VGYTDGKLVARFGQPRTLGTVPSRDAGYRADAAAAAAVALAFGVEAEAVEAGLRAAPRLPHRGAVVATIGDVAFVDDSKATNPHAALASLRGRENVVLIAGGLAKGVDLSPLAAATPVLLAVVAIGAAAPDVAAVFDGLVPVHRAGSMEEAVDLAARLADEQATVLLAPACASQDMFRDYADRGDRFAAAVRGLAERTVRG
jgi:UDP-N-acetylmuramoylalanine--D-glutamate ligase